MKTCRPESLSGGPKARLCWLKLSVISLGNSRDSYSQSNLSLSRCITSWHGAQLHNNLTATNTAYHNSHHSEHWFCCCHIDLGLFGTIQYSAIQYGALLVRAAKCIIVFVCKTLLQRCNWSVIGRAESTYSSAFHSIDSTNMTHDPAQGTFHTCVHQYNIAYVILLWHNVSASST